MPDNNPKLSKRRARDPSPADKPSKASSPRVATGVEAPVAPHQLSFLEGPANVGPTLPAQQTGKSTHKKPAKPPRHDGHRQRLRERLMATGPEAMPDYELLELLLTLSIQRRDTKALAKEMIEAFGSFAGALNAPAHRLEEMDGVGPAVVAQFQIMRAVAQRLAKSQIMLKPALSSWNDVVEYLTIAQGFEMKEQFRVLFFNKRNVLIADEVQGRGTVDHTPVYVREVVKRALELSASALILVHNHPSGDPTPSRADIDMTKLIVEATRTVGIAVHDHIIVGRNGHASLKALRHM